MSEKLLRKRLFLASLVLMVLILSITALMNINSFEEQFVEAQTVSFAVKGSDFVNSTQYALRYGKELDNFYGMHSLLVEWKDAYPEIEDARIIMKNHQTVYSYSGILDDLEIEPLREANSFEHAAINYQSAFVEGIHYVYLPIRLQSNEIAGSLELSFSDTYIQEQMAPFLAKLLKWIGGLIAFSAIALGIFSYKGKIVDKEGTLQEKLVILGVLLIMGIVQIVYGIFNYRLFDEAYTALSRMNATVAMEGIERDFESIIDRGVGYDQMSETEAYLTSLSQKVPQVKGVIFERVGGEFDASMSDEGEMTLDMVEDRYKVVTDLHPDSEGHDGRVTVVIDKDYIQSGLREIMLDSLTIFATAFFFMVEIVLFLMLYMSSHTTSKEANVVFEDENYNGGNLRILAFLIYTACYMPVSFVPKVMKNLYQPIEGVDVNFVLGLPVSVVFFGGAIFTLVGGRWIDRIGWRRVLEIGLVTLVASAILSAMAFNGWIFVLARGIYGVGYALIYISMRSFAASMKGELAKRKGFSAITSGIYAGVNTGAVFGAILLDKIGFRSVFFISGALILMSFGLLFMFFPKGAAPEQEKVVAHQAKTGIGHFLGNRQVWLFFLLVNVPMAMTVIFLDYFYPVYADGVGIGTSTIGRAYLLNGICVAYLSPLIIRSIGSKFSSRQTVIFALGMMVLSMGLFSYYGTLTMMLVSAAILGIGEGVGLASQTEYYLSLEAVKRIGRGEALGYYSNARKIAQMFGPQLFAYAIGFGYTEGIGYLGIGIACMLLIFVISGFSHMKGVKASS
jgi:predicted MFS family arabinose efflux permease